MLSICGQAGYTAVDMRKAQYTAAQLRSAGGSLSPMLLRFFFMLVVHIYYLFSGYSLVELTKANFPGPELCEAGELCVCMIIELNSWLI